MESNHDSQNDPLLEEVSPEDLRKKTYANQGIPSEDEIEEEIFIGPRPRDKRNLEVNTHSDEQPANLENEKTNTERRYVFVPSTSLADEFTNLEQKSTFSDSDKKNNIEPGSVKGRGGSRIQRQWPEGPHSQRNGLPFDLDECIIKMHENYVNSYHSKETGKELFRDHGYTQNAISVLVPLEDSEADKAILCSLQLASEISKGATKDFGVTGTDEFKKRTIEIAVENGMSIDPSCLSPKLQGLQNDLQSKRNIQNHITPLANSR